MRTTVYYAACWAMVLPGAIGALALFVGRLGRTRDEWDDHDVRSLEEWRRSQVALARAAHPSAPSAGRPDLGSGSGALDRDGRRAGVESRLLPKDPRAVNTAATGCRTTKGARRALAGCRPARPTRRHHEHGSPR